MGDASPARLGAGKRLLLTTYRKNGTPVDPPVRVVRDGDALGVWTAADSWKVKRVRNHADVLVGPCDVRRRPTGDQVPATAEICDPATTAHYRRLIVRKYGVLGRLTLFGSRLRRGTSGTLGIRVTLEP
ncbi:PPOX class F420-dependent oxidoreductase [Streptomyces lancefieldiae]|uniref:PPOX class F420-dependent oxidoreductase n=1 Tax=Streptomyces lancefieldiae TaxID=3075520 RepID=A0ABU3AR21_9ACTN|nr:PPOX class F420-dependent oxidoreductase [Streptomyces sp. DSM 40712]MDT0612619.1 PPOX class F420-dependent oxidoreductase [Streptomyces sp. DSM 40712]